MQVFNLAVLEGPYGMAVSLALPALHRPAVMLLHPAALLSFMFVFVPQWRCSGLPLVSMLQIHPWEASGYLRYVGYVCTLMATNVSRPRTGVCPILSFQLWETHLLSHTGSRSHAAVCAVLGMHLSQGVGAKDFRVKSFLPTLWWIRGSPYICKYYGNTFTHSSLLHIVIFILEIKLTYVSNAERPTLSPQALKSQENWCWRQTIHM